MKMGKRVLFSPWVIKKLEQDTDERVGKIISAIGFVRNRGKWADKEQLVFQKIDIIRNDYLSSKETIQIEDYGAGNSTDTRSMKQMHKGISEICAVSGICKTSSSPKKWGKLIFKLVQGLQPVNCLELGTCLGISAAYQLAALKLNKKNGKLTTIEGAAELASIAKKTLSMFDYSGFSILNGRFKEVLTTLLPAAQPFDFVFVDGHHDKVATYAYFEMIYPYLAEKSVLIFDDINWSGGMQQVWHKIRHDKRMNVCFDLYKWGICLVDKSVVVDNVKCYKLNI